MDDTRSTAWSTFKEKAATLRMNQHDEEERTATEESLVKFKLAQQEYKGIEERDDAIWEALLFLKSAASGEPVYSSLLGDLIDKVVEKVKDGVESVTGLDLASACDVCKVSL